MDTDVRLDRKYVIKQQGKDYVTYPGLLDLAHQQSSGRLHIATTLVQVPGKDNGQVAICTAEAKMVDETGVCYRSATGIGDASPASVKQAMTNVLVRMAETRAKARALRDLVNVAEAVDETDGGEMEPAAQRVPAVAQAQKASNGDGHAPITISLNPDAPMTRAQGTKINELRDAAGEPALTPIEAHAAGMTVSRAADEIERLTQKVAAVRN